MALKTETNTRAMERRIRRAFRDKYPRGRAEAHFEHGQWWMMAGGATWSVVDATGPGSVDGFDFERID